MCPSISCTHLSLFTASMTPFSQLFAKQQPVSIHVFKHVPSTLCMYTFVFLYILHDAFFTTTCTTTGSKHSCFYSCIHPIYVCSHLSLFTSSMTHSSPLPAQQQSVSTFVFMHVSINLMYTFVSLYILHDTFTTM